MDSPPLNINMEDTPSLLKKAPLEMIEKAGFLRGKLASLLDKGKLSQEERFPPYPAVKKGISGRRSSSIFSKLGYFPFQYREGESSLRPKNGSRESSLDRE